jgi:anti-anti-sigma regulatory factor
MPKPPAAQAGGHCSVRRLSRHVLADLPERVDQSNAEQIGGELLALIDGQTLVLVVNMTGTTTCDHACGNALTQVYQRVMANGVGLRLIAGVDTVLRTLAMCGLDRGVVPVYKTLGAALTATEPTDTVEPPVDPPGITAKVERSFPVGDVGVEMALLDADGVIIWVNSAWQAFTAVNGGDPAATGPGVSYLDVCAAAVGDLVTARWFDMLISSRLDPDGKSAGATITLSLAGRGPRRCWPPANLVPASRDVASSAAWRTVWPASATCWRSPPSGLAPPLLTSCKSPSAS